MYLDLCLETIAASRRAAGAARAVAPDAITWLPDLDVDRWESLPAPNYRSDYVRSRVLQRYGGVWMDVDTVALSPLSQLLDELDDTGMVCFGKEFGRFFGGLCAAAPGSPRSSTPGWKARTVPCRGAATGPSFPTPRWPRT